jgi:hypothetical protein
LASSNSSTVSADAERGGSGAGGSSSGKTLFKSELLWPKNEHNFPPFSNFRETSNTLWTSIFFSFETISTSKEFWWWLGLEFGSS